MNRRSILKGLLALPFAPIVAKLAPESVSEWFLNWSDRHPPKGSDQTSIWLVDAQPITASEIAHRHEERMLDLKPVLERLQRQMRDDSDRVRTNWLKRSINGF